MDWSDENYIAIIFSICGIFLAVSTLLHPPPPYQPGQVWHAFSSAPRQLAFDSTLFTDVLLLLVISPMISSYTRYTHGANTLSHHSHHLHKCRVSVAIHVSSTVYTFHMWYVLVMHITWQLLPCMTFSNRLIWTILIVILKKSFHFMHGAQNFVISVLHFSTGLWFWN